MQTIKPIISYFGSKWRLAPKIIKIFPKHLSYIEPFCGTASILIRKEFSKLEIINDIHSDLTNLYLILQSKYEDFRQKAKWMLNSEDMFSYFKMLETEDKLERAVRYYYLARFAYFGDYDRHCFMMAKKCTTPRYVNLKNLDRFRERLKRVQIYNRDYKNVIELCDIKEAFFYLDPPYYESGNKLYSHAFEEEDHKEMSEILKTIKGKFLVSYNDVEEIRELYNWATIESITTIYTSGKSHKKAQEVLISNYRFKPTFLDEFIPQEVF